MNIWYLRGAWLPPLVCRIPTATQGYARYSDATPSAARSAHSIRKGRYIVANKRKSGAVVEEMDSPASAHAAVEPALYGALEWRLIGPHRGGRVVAVAGDPTHAQTFYLARLGAVSGRPPMAACIGRMSPMASSSAPQSARSPSPPRIPMSSTSAWARPPSAATSRMAMASTNPPMAAKRGSTWAWPPRATSAKVRVHPRNADLVYVAALGHAHGPNRERGIYRSRDGGNKWEQIADARRRGRRDRSLARSASTRASSTPRSGRRCVGRTS